MRDDNAFYFSILPTGDPDIPAPSPQIQQDALDDVQQQFVTLMEQAAVDPDPWKAIRIMVNAEKILGIYTNCRFNMLAKAEAEFQSDLHKIWRMARRQFIRRALLSPAHEFPLYLDDQRNPELCLDGPDALEDFHAVERHLDERQPLFDDLHKHQRN
jgi:hypothetical protein